jgi:hypothetical protein
MLGIMALSAGLAQARLAHKEFRSFDFSFTGGPPAGMAVDQTTHDIYVTDQASGAVYKFTEAGASIDGAGNPSTEPLIAGAGGALIGGLAVDNSSGASAHDLYVPVPGSNAVDKYTPAGGLICQLNVEAPAPNPCPGAAGHLAPVGFSGPEGAAVDPTTGDVYIANTGAAVIDVFSSSGAYIASTAGEGEFALTEPRTLSVDSAGNIYVVAGNSHFGANQVARGLVKFTPKSPGATEWTESVIDEHAGVGGEYGSGVATDATGNVYFSAYIEGGFGFGPIFEYGPTGTLLSTFATGASERIAFGWGMAVDNAAKDIYYPNDTNSPFSVLVYNTFNAPTVTTGAATEVEYTSAKVAGTVNAEGLTIAACFFEYSKEEPKIKAGEGQKVACSTSEEAVSVKLEPLEAGVKYYYALSAEAEGHVTSGEIGSFETPPLITVATEAATEVQAESAELHGKVTAPVGGHYYFEYARVGEPLGELTTPRTTEVHLGPSGAPVAVTAAVSGLEPAGTHYHFRLVAISEGAVTPVDGGELEIETRPAAPTVVKQSSSHEERHSVLLAGEVNPKKSETRYFFEYGINEVSEHSTSETTVPGTPGLAPVPIGPVSLSELKPGTVYHYRLVASSTGGTARGPEATFTTKAPTPPLVESESSAQVTQTTATLRATVNPSGLPTTYALEVGTEVEPGKIAYTPSFGEVGSGATPEELTFGVSNLLPGTTYHYRIVVLNEDGSAEGPDQTFATPGFPPVILAPPPVQLIPIIPAPPPPRPLPIIETRAEKYAKAVKLCDRKPKGKRPPCLRTAKKKYGPVKKKKKK